MVSSGNRYAFVITLNVDFINLSPSCVTSDASVIESIEQLKIIKQSLPHLIKQKTDFYQNKSAYLDDLKKFDFNSFNSCKIAIEKSKDEISNIESKQLLNKSQIEENNEFLSNIFSTLEINLKSASSISYKIISD